MEPGHKRDLFYADEIAELLDTNPGVTFIPVLSEAEDDVSWDGEKGFVHESVDAHLRRLDLGGEGDVYACGPPPMIDALVPVLFMNDFDTDRTFFDRFTPSNEDAKLEVQLSL